MTRPPSRSALCARRRPALLAALLALATAALLVAPAVASAAKRTFNYRVPIAVEGYEVKQEITAGPRPRVDGSIIKMETDIVDATGKPIPIQRLMLHHIVFINLDRPDATCDSFLNWDSRTVFAPSRERFYAAGEERAKLRLPEGYGYRIREGGAPVWGINYMVMNHRQTPDRGFVRYRVTVDDDPSLTPVEPYWLDARNCKADPIYNVPGTGKRSSATHVERSTFTMPQSGRIIAGGGHVHGGARKLALRRPDCEERRIAQSVPTWGLPKHPFYNVRPVLHEPGPINMSAFASERGIPVRAGERIRLDSRYENTRPHTRVMGIMVIYVAHDPSVKEKCAPRPDDVVNVGTDRPGRKDPVPFRVPLTGLDENGKAVTISAPPGKLRNLRPGAKIRVVDRAFKRPNVRVRRGAKVRWKFNSAELHNVTLANGPAAIGSPNLDDGREFARRLRRPGTYRLFCSLHPVQMTERIEVVRRKRR